MSERRAVAEHATDGRPTVEDWELDDPARQDVAAVRAIRDEVGRRVSALLESLGVAAG
jgi:hypothetical protein